MFRSKVLSSHLQKGLVTLFKAPVTTFLRILGHVTVFLENWNTTDMGLLLTFNMIVFSSENRVKNSRHIYRLNWKLGNSGKKKKKNPSPNRAQNLQSGGLLVSKCHQGSLGCAVVINNSKSLSTLKQCLCYPWLQVCCCSHSGTQADRAGII